MASSLMVPLLDLVSCINYSITWGFEMVWILEMALRA
jgi:hypothetical protein